MMCDLLGQSSLGVVRWLKICSKVPAHSSLFVRNWSRPKIFLTVAAIDECSYWESGRGPMGRWTTARIATKDTMSFRPCIIFWNMAFAPGLPQRKPWVFDLALVFGTWLAPDCHRGNRELSTLHSFLEHGLLQTYKSLRTGTSLSTWDLKSWVLYPRLENLDRHWTKHTVRLPPKPQKPDCSWLRETADDNVLFNSLPWIYKIIHSLKVRRQN